MRILQLTPQFPWPTHQGTTLRNFHILRGLAQKHQVHLFSLLGPGDAPEAGPVATWAASVTTGPQPRRGTAERLRDLFTTPLPDMARRLWHPLSFQALHQCVQNIQPQVLLIEGIEMAPYFFALRANHAIPGQVVYDAHNAETLLQKRAALADSRRPRRWPAAAYSLIQTLKLRHYEAQLLRAVDGVAAVSEPDAAFLHRLAPATPITVVSNGVDMASYQPDQTFPRVLQGPGPHWVFTGKMDFRPNVDAVLWFAQQVMPVLHRLGVHGHFWVVGRNPHPRLKSLRNREDVIITGQVPDVRPYIVQADVYVVPLLAGGGTRFKILEALALAKPVVSTHLGADGIPVKHETHAFLADKPENFARAIIRMLEHPQEARAMGWRGRAFVAQHYDWSVIIPKLEALFRK